MSLKEYFKKRDFDSTPEPKGGKPEEDDQLRFVIQRHHASRLHYDLRLEMHGTLLSWAVPKGPSMNPADKRLAIQTEDHPIDYLYFEGNIPKGNYGAGNMIIWDTGTYQAAYGKSFNDLQKQFAQGNLKLELHGRKVKGTFSLVKTNRGDAGNQWLFMKKKDEYATDQPYDSEEYIDYESGEEGETIAPGFYKPMLATKADAIFNKPGWIYELKWDGYRALASIQQGKVHLYSRNGISFKEKFSTIYENLKAIPHDTVLDGEIVSLNEDGVSVFQALQNYPKVREGELRYYVFDMLYLNGHDITSLTLLERKSLIEDVIDGIESVYYCDHVEGMGSVFYQKAIDIGMEGVIAKKSASTYSPGIRSESWLKIKAYESQEVIICGYTTSKDGGAGFGSLILGVFEGDLLRYIGNCGSGFDSQTIRDLMELFEPIVTEASPFAEKINLKGRKPTWIKPEYICEVKFAEWTKSGHMRHPVYKGLRMDKNPVEIEKESKTEAPKPKSQNKSNSGGGTLNLDGVEVPISNLDKIYWPKEKYTKYDLIDYYLQVSETMLPYLIDRPQNMHRHPEGINGQGFYHKDTSGIFPHWIETLKVHSKSKEDTIEYLLCQNEATLLYMANLGCIEINPWISRKGSLDSPDFTVIDLDPSSKNTFEEVIQVAQAVKEVLDLGDVKGFCKTSGSSGLHIYLPLEQGYSYDEARDFTKLLCYYVQELVPDITSMERSVKKRNDKIYLDFLQNRKGQTLAAPYCARPKPGATVSTPLDWDEVKSGLQMKDFNIKTVPERIEEKGDLFKGVLEYKNNIELILSKLSE